MPISDGLVIAEIRAPDNLIGKNLIEANLRKNHNLNVIAIRNADEQVDFLFRPAEYRIRKNDILLLAGAELNIHGFTGTQKPVNSSSGLKTLYQKLFNS